MKTFFISDLHLEASQSTITNIFLGFLETRARQAQALYILGDLFEVWVGDDDDSPFIRQVITGLAALAQHTPLYFMHGNRDFLLGEAFFKATGGQWLEDGTVMDLYGTPTLLMHGDVLCTDDTAYQAFRRQVRTPEFKREFLNKPLAERHAIAQAMRQQSQQHTGSAEEIIMDVTPHAVVDAMQSAQVTQLIHGHTHRPAIHTLEINGQPAKRMVLAAWHEKGNMLACSSQATPQLIDFANE